MIQCASFLGCSATLVERGAWAGDNSWISGKKILDPHVHVVDGRHPSVPKMTTTDGDYVNGDLQLVARSIGKNMEDSGTSTVLGMPGWSEIDEEDPLAINQTLKVSALLPGHLKMFAIGAADPYRSSDKKHMLRVEKALAAGKVKALKCYLGYLPFGPDDDARRPYYKLAQKYRIPVIFHTGDTYSKLAKVRLAHPLRVDDIAVEYPEMKIVLAHLGNPWILDAAEVIYKNNQFGDGNVWADVSALFIREQSDHYEKTGILDDIRQKVRHAIAYSQRPDRFLYAQATGR